MEEETENLPKYLKILSIAAFLCISQALLLFSSRLLTAYPTQFILWNTSWLEATSKIHF